MVPMVSPCLPLNVYNLLQVLVHGQPGEEVCLELILRVVADVGLVVSFACCSPREFHLHKLLSLPSNLMFTCIYRDFQMLESQPFWQPLPVQNLILLIILSQP
uniref:Putative GTP-binding protein OBGC2 isoform X1 n=1 Tax=Rhizophora mucronata TaxID=61149 RepID=A0A2P2MRG5_RHIMU